MALAVNLKVGEKFMVDGPCVIQFVKHKGKNQIIVGCHAPQTTKITRFGPDGQPRCRRDKDENDNEV